MAAKRKPKTSKRKTKASKGRPDAAAAGPGTPPVAPRGGRKKKAKRLPAGSTDSVLRESIDGARLGRLLNQPVERSAVPGNRDVAAAEKVGDLQHLALLPAFIAQRLERLGVQPQNAGHAARRRVRSRLHGHGSLLNDLQPGGKVQHAREYDRVIFAETQPRRALTSLDDLGTFRFKLQQGGRSTDK